jgi:hypothetical protein
VPLMLKRNERLSHTAFTQLQLQPLLVALGFVPSQPESFQCLDLKYSLKPLA